MVKNIFTKKELVFINKIAKSAFEDGDKPVVVIAIVGAILSNLIKMSDGSLTRKNIIKWVKMSMED